MAIESGTVGKVDVTPGAALVKGIMFVSDALEELDIASNASGNPRIDSIILQRDLVAQTVRLVVSAGTPAATPAKPAIDTVNEIEVAWVWVEDGYDDTTDIIGEEEIHDERIFKYSGPSQPIGTRDNLLSNAEYIGIANNAVSNAIAGWKLNTVGALSGTNATTFRGVYLTFSSATNNEGIETTTTLNLVHDDTILVTLFGNIFRATSGVVSIKIYSVNTSTGASTLLRTKYFRPANASINSFYIREPITTQENAIRIRFDTESAAAVDAFNLGELSLTLGHLPTLAYNHEVIWLDEPMTDAAWTSTAKSTGTTTISLATADFGSIFRPYMHGVILRVRCRDSGSAAAATTSAQLQFYHYTQPTAIPDITYAPAIVSAAGRPNDSWEENVVVVPLDASSPDARFRVYADATGAGTLDATIQVIGVIT